MYNYLENITANVGDKIAEYYSPDEIKEALKDRDAFAETLYDELWCDDDVTGNGSGSYTYSRDTAKGYVEDNFKVLVEALEEFDQLKELGYKLRDGEWEWLDVTIRCYLLYQAVDKALDELEEEMR